MSDLHPSNTTGEPHGAALTMTRAAPPKAELSVIATFPEKYFLENLVVRGDNSLIVSDLTRKGLWYIPPSVGDGAAEPVPLVSFDQPTLCIVEVRPDVFLVATSNLYTTHESTLHRLDLRGWAPGTPATTTEVLRFLAIAQSLNGGCVIAPGVLLFADSFAGLIWRVDLDADDRATASLWLKHYSMGHDPNGGKLADQPGINGLRFVGSTSHVYYTSTVHKLFMRVRVDPITRGPLGEPELVASGFWYDDFCVDEGNGVAYVTTHRENTIEAIWLEPSRNVSTEPPGEGATSTGQNRMTVAGDPFDDRLVGPSSAAWGRQAGEAGRVAFLTSDGGTKAPPPDGIVRPAKVLRVTFGAV